MKFGQFIFESRLSEDRDSSLYKARRLSGGPTAAIRVFSEALGRDTEWRAEFRTKVRQVASIVHPALMPISEFGSDGDRFFYVTPYYEDGSIARLLGKPDPAGASRLVRAMALGLEEAHRKETIHGNIRPSQVLLDGRARPVLAGLAMGALLAGPETTTGTHVVGDLSLYRSPEQLSGQEPSVRSDIFSLGVLLAHLATGRPPFEGDTEFAIIAGRMQNPEVLRPFSLPNGAEELEVIIRRCLLPDPDQRYASAGELAGALAQFDRPVRRDPGVVGDTGSPSGLFRGVGSTTRSAGVKPKETQYEAVMDRARRQRLVVTGLVGGAAVLLAFGLLFLGGQTVLGALGAKSTPQATAVPSQTVVASAPGGRPTETPAARPSGTVNPGASPSPSASRTSTPGANGTSTPNAGANLVKDPLALTAVVNREAGLPAEFVPSDLVSTASAVRAVRGNHRVRAVVLDPLTRMAAAARADGIELTVSSAYRSYSEQATTYQYWVDTLGRTQADRVSARPGFSEHQLGLAVDFASPVNGYELEDSFANTPEGKWLFKNAARFGFVLRYPAGKEGVTGYAYEPWHYRYVGTDAQRIADRGQTLEEAFPNR